MAKLASPLDADLSERKAIGRAHLDSNRVEEALQIYARILRDYPDDVDAFLFLGDCYLADGDADTALYLYTQALDRGSNSPEIERRVGLARTKCIERWSAPAEFRRLGFTPHEAVPVNPQAVIQLLQSLACPANPVTEKEVYGATHLLEEIIHSEHPAQAVAERLDEIDALLPALLELNIRQARADGRPDLAHALQNLLENIHLQKNSRTEANTSGATRPQPPELLRILFLEPKAAEPFSRNNLLAESLSDLGCQTTVLSDFPAGRLGQYDAVIARRPHGDPRLLEGLAACAGARIPVILDLDADFDQMPMDHPEYETFGLGTPAHAKAYATALLLANVIRVPSETLAAMVNSNGKPVRVIPEGWTRSNDLWSKPAGSRHTLNLGWAGSAGQLEDVFQIRRMVIRILREFPQVRLVIGGDPQVYKLFDTLPESRRLFLPTVSAEDYPYLLGQIDILLVPLRNTPFNRVISDRQLMEAGVRRIPWVASPIPAFTTWHAGGLIAHTVDEWHTYLRQLVLDAGLRTTLGRAGRQRAEIREMKHLGHTWLALIEKAVVEKAQA